MIKNKLQNSNQNRGKEEAKPKYKQQVFVNSGSEHSFSSDEYQSKEKIQLASPGKNLIKKSTTLKNMKSGFKRHSSMELQKYNMEDLYESDQSKNRGFLQS